MKIFESVVSFKNLFLTLFFVLFFFIKLYTKYAIFNQTIYKVKNNKNNNRNK